MSGCVKIEKSNSEKCKLEWRFGAHTFLQRDWNLHTFAVAKAAPPPPDKPVATDHAIPSIIHNINFGSINHTKTATSKRLFDSERVLRVLWKVKKNFGLKKYWRESHAFRAGNELHCERYDKVRWDSLSSKPFFPQKTPFSIFFLRFVPILIRVWPFRRCSKIT